MSQGNPTKLTYDQYLEALRCHRIHMDTPTSSDLARSWGLSTWTVINAINRGIKQYDQQIYKKHGDQSNDHAR